VCNFLLVGLCLSWRRTVNDIYFFLTFISYFFPHIIFALSVCRHVWLINITIFSNEALPWNLIVQDHWRWGLSRACLAKQNTLLHCKWSRTQEDGVALVSNSIISTQPTNGVIGYAELAQKIRFSITYAHRRRCDCLASSAPFTNTHTYLFTYRR